MEISVSGAHAQSVKTFFFWKSPVFWKFLFWKSPTNFDRQLRRRHFFLSSSPKFETKTSSNLDEDLFLVLSSFLAQNCPNFRSSQDFILQFLYLFLWLALSQSLTTFFFRTSALIENHLSLSRNIG